MEANRRQRLRWWLGGGFGFATLCAAVAYAALGNSTFEGNDGNMVSNGNTDWGSPAPNLSTKTDQPTGQSDDSFGQGTKEDTPTPTVVNGSIPNNKSDLTQFSVSNETVGGIQYMYLRWTRANTLGTANLDFEFNQSSTLSANGVTFLRTAGDILITFDFAGGGDPTKVALGLLTWITSGSTAQCEASNSLPCWGNRVDLSAAGFANGAVNLVPIFDPIQNINIAEITFGEAAIDLNGSGIVPPGTCNPFSSAYAKSRSSTSFTAALKDFIAPQSISFQTCGTINIHKLDDANNPLAGAAFTLFGGSPTGTTCSGSAVSPPKTCTTNASGNCTMSDVPFGTYCLAETTTPTGFSTVNAQTVTLSAGSATVTVNLTDPRTFRIITIVCQEGLDKLYPSTVTLGGTGKTSLKLSDLPAGLSESTVCNLAAAKFGDLAFGTYSESIAIPQSQP
jgi:hypothetical protein